MKTVVPVEINWQPNQQVSVCGSRHRRNIMCNLLRGIFWRFAYYSNTKFWTSLYPVSICVWGCFAYFCVYFNFCCSVKSEKVETYLLCTIFWDVCYFLCDPIVLQKMACYSNITVSNIWCNCGLIKSFVVYPIFTPKKRLIIHCKLGELDLMECPIRCSHHSFPDHYHFCPYCGCKLETDHSKI